MHNKLSQVEILKKVLADEERLGYPRFKARIVSFMVQAYNVNEETAKEHVFSSEVQDRIHSDIDWAQHMGPRFWAKEIVEYYVRK
jgi:hypothetical protein